MLDVNDTTKNAYLTENIPKYITISFPQGDHADITNDSILEESMKLTQSICEENKPIAGGCNSSQFEITVADVDEDLTDKKINVTISCKDPYYRGRYGDLTKIYDVHDVVIQRTSYYECINPTYVNQDLAFTSSDASSAGIMHSAYIPEVEGWDVLKINTGSGADWNSLKITVSQTFEDGTSVTTTITDDYDGIIQLNPACTSVRITIQDTSGASAADVLISNLKTYLVTHPSVADTEYWQKLYGYVDTSEIDDIKLFEGTIKSSKRQQNKRFKDIVAYDYLYYLKDEDMSVLFRTESFGLADIHHKGEWVKGNTYAKGDIVHCDYAIQVSGGVYQDVGGWFEYLKPVDSSWGKWNPYELYTGYFDSQYGINGKEILKKLSGEKKVTTTVKKVRDKIFEYLGFEQQSVTLPLDNMTLWIKASDTKITLMSLLGYICNLNAVFGFYNPHTERFEYISADLSNPYAIGKNYDMDGAEYSDNIFECKAYNIINDNGEALIGADTPCMSVRYSFLVKDQYSVSDLISTISSGLYATPKLKFTPTKLKTVGLPFLTPGDAISYKVDEYTRDDDGELVETEKTITTVVLKRTLSGILALTDDIEAVYEE